MTFKFVPIKPEEIGSYMDFWENIGAPLQTFEPDECCGEGISQALGELSGDSWTCPKCGCEWNPRMVGSVRHWEPHPEVMIFRRRQCFST